MKIIISPAKKMNIREDEPVPVRKPVFFDEAQELRELLKQKSFEELKALWKCNDKIARQNMERLNILLPDKNLTPALLAYEGLQYQSMAPQVFSEEQWEYAKEHLRILSGMYGILRPDDGVILYRLEMQAKLETDRGKDLYDYWGEKIYRELAKEETCILNLASKEYSRAVEKYLEKDIKFVTCTFGELVNEKVKVKGTRAKMARGEMVRILSEKRVETLEEVKEFDGLGYHYCEELSTERELVFLPDGKKEDL